MPEQRLQWCRLNASLQSLISFFIELRGPSWLQAFMCAISTRNWLPGYNGGPSAMADPPRPSIAKSSAKP